MTATSYSGGNATSETYVRLVICLDQVLNELSAVLTATTCAREVTMNPAVNHHSTPENEHMMQQTKYK